MSKINVSRKLKVWDSLLGHSIPNTRKADTKAARAVTQSSTFVSFSLFKYRENSQPLMWKGFLTSNTGVDTCTFPFTTTKRLGSSPKTCGRSKHVAVIFMSVKASMPKV